MSYRRFQKTRKATNHCIRHGRSLWSANQLPAQGVKCTVVVASFSREFTWQSPSLIEFRLSEGLRPRYDFLSGTVLSTQIYRLNAELSSFRDKVKPIFQVFDLPAPRQFVYVPYVTYSVSCRMFSKSEWEENKSVWMKRNWKCVWESRVSVLLEQNDSKRIDQFD